MLNRTKGFTLIELLVVVAIIGILSAIAIPNLLLAIQRSKQRRTMVDMRNIATAWESRATETGRYNAAAGVDSADQIVTQDQISAFLAPTYIRTFPQHDAWMRPFAFFCDQAVGASSNGQSYAIVSGGHDEVISPQIFTGPFTNYDCDIIYANGSFLSYPEGMSTSTSTH